MDSSPLPSFAVDHQSNNRRLEMTLDAMIATRVELEKIEKDITVEKERLEQMATSNDKKEKQTYYYENAILTADKKREEAQNKLRELEDELDERDDIEGKVLERKLEEVDMKLKKRLDKLQQEMDAARREAEAEKEVLRETPKLLITKSVRAEKERTERMKTKVSSLKREIETCDQRIQYCREEMDRLQLVPVSKKVVVLEIRKEQGQKKIEELKATMEECRKIDLLISEKRNKEIRMQEERERQKTVKWLQGEN